MIIFEIFMFFIDNVPNVLLNPINLCVAVVCCEGKQIKENILLNISLTVVKYVLKTMILFSLATYPIICYWCVVLK